VATLVIAFLAGILLVVLSLVVVLVRVVQGRVTLSAVVLSFFAILGATTVGIVAPLQFFPLVSGGFLPRTETEVSSPDDRYQLTVTTRTAFPADGWIDASGVVGFNLTDKVTRQTLSSARATLFERGFFDAPIVRWDRTGVTVTRFDQSRPTERVRLPFAVSRR
jgi:hypothetical protein